jgi:chromosome segregation ATPase
MEDAVAAAEEARGMEEQKVARLESFVSEYEEEMTTLTAQRDTLREQIIALEDANGRLQSEGIVNADLRQQLEQVIKFTYVGFQ